MTLDLARTGFGITGTVDHDIVRKLAPRIESAGFRTLWFNHTGDGSALASMQAAAEVTSTLRLASGVIPIDKMPVDDVVRVTRERNLPLNRCIIGIGASAGPSPLTTIQEGTQILYGELGATVYVGALGPKMRRLAVTEADGELLNWLTPDAARQAMIEKQGDLSGSGKESAGVSLYIRVAMGRNALPALEKEAAHYEGVPSYAANFKRFGIAAMDAAVYGETAEEVRAGLDRYTNVVDEAVVRAITLNASLDEFNALVEAVSG